MKIRDLILAVIVIIIWGVNFTVIKLGLSEIPPILLVALRYIFASLPAIAFVKRPETSWKYIIAYGMTVGVGQFSCLFCAVKIGMPAGVSSVILQAQAFFTIIFAAIIFKESIKINQFIGLSVSVMGLFLISGNKINGIPMVPIGALLLTLLAAFFWGISNIIAMQASKEATSKGKRLNMLSLVVWSSIVPPLPMLLVTLILDKPKTVWYALSNLNALSVFSILYLALISTVIAYGIWGTLIAKYPAGKVAPLSILVPVIGLITAQIVLKEYLSIVQWVGGVIIILGLLISNFGGVLRNLNTIKLKGLDR